MYFVISENNSINEPNHQILGALHLGAGDSAFITATGYVIAQEGGTTGVYLDGYTNGSTLTVNGMVSSPEIGIYALGSHNTINIAGQVYGGVSSSGEENAINITSTGYVSGNVTIAGHYSSLSNAGVISGPNGFGVQMVDSEIVNTGTITGGLFSDGAGMGFIRNSGTITGGLYSQTEDTKTGSIYIDNSGIFQGGASIGGGGSTVTNSGTMDGVGFDGGDNTVTNTGTMNGDVSFGAGNDSFDSSHGHTFGTISGGEGNDTLTGGVEDEMFAGGPGHDIIDGRGGNNTVIYYDSVHRVYVDLNTDTAKYGNAAGDQISNIQNVYGTFKGDVLIGDSGANVLNGLLGNDTLTGNDGNDTLILLGRGAAFLDGGAGNDIIQLATAAEGTYGRAFTISDHINGGTGFDTMYLTGTANVAFAADTVVNVERIVAEDGFNYHFVSNDATVGAGAILNVDASALGSTHSLFFDGSAETDGRFVLDGGAGKDTLIGGALGDTFNGGGGADKITGGLGSDKFVFDEVTNSTSNRYDTLVGFNANGDRILLPAEVNAVDATVDGAALSSSSFNTDLHTTLNGHLLAGDAILVNATGGDLSGHTFLVVDANGAAGYQGSADFVIDVTGYSGTFSAGTFG